MRGRLLKSTSKCFTASSLLRTHACHRLYPRSLSSSSPPSDSTQTLHHELTTRTLPLIHDYLTPTPSHLLSLTLSSFRPSLSTPPPLPSTTSAAPLPPGHHLVYFPTPVPTSALLPDGTDTLHYPGDPYTHRLWAGGSVTLHRTDPLLLDGSRAVCHETVHDVRLTPPSSPEKVFVSIFRRYALDTPIASTPAITERRDLVFLRLPRTASSRVLRPPRAPDFTHALTPSAALLFRFSALTFNAHDIHLCPAAAGGEAVVHGPLTLVLLLTFVQQWLTRTGRGKKVKGIEYRNLKMLFAGEEMRLCGREKGAEGEVEVWIEDQRGGLAVRGVVSVD